MGTSGDAEDEESGLQIGPAASTPSDQTIISEKETGPCTPEGFEKTTTPRIVGACLFIFLVVVIVAFATSPDPKGPEALALKGPGCGTFTSSFFARGETHSFTLSMGSQVRTYQLRVPPDYNGTSRVPLVLDVHGWGSSGLEEERGMGMSTVADREGFIVVYPDGMSDISQKWGAWNATGSVLSPGPKGPTCDTKSVKEAYCYDTCKKRTQGCDPSKCEWASCVDDIAFFGAMLDDIEAKLCIDPDRVHVTGMSNGAMMAYQLGVEMSSRLASIAPGAGSPHYGFDAAPSNPLSIMDVHGSTDDLIPSGPAMSKETNPTRTKSSDGWYYTPKALSMATWAGAANCVDPTATSTYATKYDGSQGLACMQYGKACNTGIDVVRCSFNGGHYWPKVSADLVWNFFKSHPRPQKAVAAVNTNYPGYVSGVTVRGTVTVSQKSPTVLTVSYNLTGCAPGITAGVHIHVGTSCHDASGAGGHYYSAALASDPWLTPMYTADPNTGDANGSFDVAAGLTVAQVLNHTIVVHGADTTNLATRVACGRLA